METEEEVDILMSSDVYSATLSTKSITFSRAQTGWLFREDKTVGAVSVPPTFTGSCISSLFTRVKKKPQTIQEHVVGIIYNPFILFVSWESTVKNNESGGNEVK